MLGSKLKKSYKTNGYLQRSIAAIIKLGNAYIRKMKNIEALKTNTVQIMKTKGNVHFKLV